MKKFFKILGVLVGTLSLVIIVCVLVLLKNLPSPTQVGQYLRPSTSKAALKSLNKKDEAVAAAPAPSETTPAPSESSNEPKATYKLTSEEDRLLLEDLTDQRKPLSEVCGSMDQFSRIHMDGYSFKNFGQAYKDSVLEDKKDPVIQALKPSLRYVFNIPEMRALMDEAIEAAEREENTDDLMSKAGFYAKAYAAYRSLQNNKQQVENIMDRSYHLMIMSKVIAKKPELLTDSAVQNYCGDIEKALNRSTATSFEEERQAFNEFIEQSGVSPEEVGYDPNYRTELKVELSTQGRGNLNMKGGWIDGILKPTPEEIEAITKEAKSKSP